MAAIPTSMANASADTSLDDAYQGYHAHVVMVGPVNEDRRPKRCTKAATEHELGQQEVLTCSRRQLQDFKCFFLGIFLVQEMTRIVKDAASLSILGATWSSLIA